MYTMTHNISVAVKVFEQTAIKTQLLQIIYIKYIILIISSIDNVRR